MHRCVLWSSVVRSIKGESGSGSVAANMALDGLCHTESRATGRAAATEKDLQEKDQPMEPAFQCVMIPTPIDLARFK